MNILTYKSSASTDKDKYDICHISAVQGEYIMRALKTSHHPIGNIHITKIYPEGVAKEVMKKLRSPEYGGVGKFTPTQLTVVNKSGEEIPIQLSAALIYNGKGQEIASVGIFTDLRSRVMMEKKLEETHLQLVSSEKMASLGKLAAGIAHEIGNPIGIILGYLDLLNSGDISEADKKDFLSRIESEIIRVNRIIRQLLDFSRPSSGEPEKTRVHDLVKMTLGTWNRRAASSI
jgi:two-component system NtrC family sensor kinase